MAAQNETHPSESPFSKTHGLGCGTTQVGEKRKETDNVILC